MKPCNKIYFIILFSFFYFIPNISFQLGPSNPSCFETGTCNLWHNPLQTMTQPWIDVWEIGGVNFFFVIIWGIIVGVIWLGTHHSMIAGVVGIGLAGLYVWDEKTLLVGGVLLAAAVGICLYQLVVVRSQYPTN